MKVCKWLKGLVEKPKLLPTKMAIRPLWYKVARKEIGVKEIPGKKHNKRILEYHMASKLTATEDEVPWCASFVNWCMAQAGVDTPRSAAARSYLGWGTECEPYEGCVVVLKRGNSTWQGHVGFFVKETRSQVWILGGNQGDKVSIAPYSKSRVLGYRTPNQQTQKLDYPRP